MPKLKKTPQQKMDIALRTALVGGIEEQGLNVELLCRFLCIAPSTYARKKKNPDSFTLRELRFISRKLHLNGEQLCKIMGVPYRN